MTVFLGPGLRRDDDSSNAFFVPSPEHSRRREGLQRVSVQTPFNRLGGIFSLSPSRTGRVSMFAPRLRTAALALAAAFSLSACSYDDGYGYGGLNIGYGSAGYYDPYYGYGYGGYAPYWGWYDNYYYPGTGLFIYDRFGGRHRWSDRHRRHWEGRRHHWRGDRGDRWDDFRRDRRHDRRDFRRDRRDDRREFRRDRRELRRDFREGDIDRREFRQQRRENRREFRRERRDDRRDFRRDRRRDD